MGEAGNDTGTDGVTDARDYNRNLAGPPARSDGSGRLVGHDNVYVQPYQFLGQLSKVARLVFGGPDLQLEVPSLAITDVVK